MRDKNLKVLIVNDDIDVVIFITFASMLIFRNNLTCGYIGYL